MKEKPTMTCEKCGGTGKFTLRPKLAGTLAKFKRGARLTSLQIENAHCSATNAINRLEKLRALGFLDREKVGRFYEYFLSAK